MSYFRAKNSERNAVADNPWPSSILIIHAGVDKPA